MPWLSVGLAFLLAQAQPGPQLKIVILEGEGAINNIKQRTAREAIVQVEDENDRPVAGAVVLFTLPDRGASGVFANGTTRVAVTTDAQGRAAASGLRPNSVAGEMEIRVEASYQGARATSIIRQRNAATVAAAGSGKLIAILAIAGGGAGAAVFAATRRGREPARTPAPTPTATTVTAGSPSVGPPR